VQQLEGEILLLPRVGELLPEAARAPEGVAPDAEPGAREGERTEGPRRPAGGSAEDPRERVQGLGVAAQDLEGDDPKLGLPEEEVAHPCEGVGWLEERVVVQKTQKIAARLPCGQVP